MPGVLLIEMMAQAGGVMLLTIPENEGKLAYLAGVEKARFRKPVIPGDTLITEISMLRSRASLGWVKATTKVAGKSRLRGGTRLRRRGASAGQRQSEAIGHTAPDR
jgi:3-hydroxymyristoyl/3-hydroxydecanoyl-(acyl carrier protein) dehydratase